jgi:thiamine biosynthesis lipoprotein
MKMNCVSGFYFDTINTKAAFSRCKYYEKLLSRFERDSDVSRINHAQGMPVTVSDETVCILKLALYYHEISGGAFNPTLGVVSSTWKQCLSEDRTPEEQTIRQMLLRVTFSETEINGNRVMLPAGLQLDLGGIAKGYIEDRIADELREAGVQNALLNFGGNILSVGGHPRGDAWSIGLKTPFGTDKECWAIAACRDSAISTSGVYERGKTINNIRYHHILDPETGFPVKNGIYAVSVFTEKAVDADALSTAFFVAGVEKGAHLLKKQDALFACLMEDGSLVKSPELRLDMGRE